MTFLKTLMAAYTALVPAQLDAIADSNPFPADPSAARTAAPIDALSGDLGAATPYCIWVTSPWGCTDLYDVRPGVNYLICSCTGYRFRYWF